MPNTSSSRVRQHLGVNDALAYGGCDFTAGQIGACKFKDGGDDDRLL